MNRTLCRFEELLADKIKEAELILLKYSQAKLFPSDIHALQTKGAVDKSSCLYQLFPFLDTDRLVPARSACASYNMKNPIVLQPCDYFVKLLINQYHKDAVLGGKEKVLNNLRQ